MSFTVSGLSADPFQPLFGLSDEALAEHGAVRHVAGAEGRYPCRISLRDAAPGETLLLVNYEHQSAASPYRSNYAIYVREAATTPATFTDELPPVLQGRPIALRAFDEAGMLIAAELVSADQDLTAAIGRGLGQPEAAYLHAHNAAHGCFAARIDRS
jgi:hypothetical protein